MFRALFAGIHRVTESLNRFAGLLDQASDAMEHNGEESKGVFSPGKPTPIGYESDESAEVPSPIQAKGKAKTRS